MENDEKHRKELEESGWKVIILWECDILKRFDELMEDTEKRLAGDMKQNGILEDKG